MTRKRNISGRVLYIILIWCVYSFKMVLVGVGGSGIRVDDLLIFCALVLLFWRGDLSRVKRSRAFNLYLGFVAVNLVSALWNGLSGRVGLAISLFFVARMLEYMVFYYIGYGVARSGISLSRMLSYYLAALCVAVPLQMLGILPVVGGFQGITTRAVGNTNGPYELAVVAAFLLCYLGYAQKKRASGLFAFLLILLSASRITFVATTFSLIKAMISRPRNAWIIGSASVAAVALLVFLPLRSTSNSSSEEPVGIIERLSSAISGTSLNSLKDAYSNAPVYRTSQDYLDNTFQTAIDDADASDGDPSGLIRVFRWATLIKSTLAGADSIIVGLGPSFASAAVDGYFVRVFIETGLLGLLTFCWFAKTVLFEHCRSSGPFREYVFIILATACFIDIFVSYKPMLLLWLWHGMHQFSTQGFKRGSLALAPGKPRPGQEQLSKIQEI